MRMGECPVRPYLSAPFRTVRGRGRLCMFPVRRAAVFRLSPSNPDSHGGTTGASGSCGTRSAGGRQRNGAYAPQAPIGVSAWVSGARRCQACGARRFAEPASRSHDRGHFQLLGTLGPGPQVRSFLARRLPAVLVRALHCLLGASLFECPKVEKSSAICALCSGFRPCAPYCVRGMACGKRGWVHRRALVCCRGYKRAMGAMHAPRIR